VHAAISPETAARSNVAVGQLHLEIATRQTIDTGTCHFFDHLLGGQGPLSKGALRGDFAEYCGLFRRTSC